MIRRPLSIGRTAVRLPESRMEIKKQCFGKLEEVFPPGPEGLREVPSRCLECRYKTECLRAALASKEGVAFKERRVMQADQRGLIGRLRRWSELKSLARERDEIKKKGDG
jgi:hypothetical protein